MLKSVGEELLSVVPYITEDALIVYDQKVKLYSNGMVKITNYGRKIERLKDGFEQRKTKVSNHHVKEEKEKEERIRMDSLSRTRNQLIDYVCEHEKEWKSFITLTFAENLHDLSIANKKFDNYLTQIRKVYPDLKYIGVPEFQKRGAVHYHLLTNIDVNTNLIPLREKKRLYNPSTKKKQTLEYYDLKHWSYGFSSAYDLAQTDDNFNPALYITKYLYKDIDDRLFNRKKLLKSNNLRNPDTYILNKNCKAYNYALQFISEKGYDINHFEFEPKQEYQIPFTIYNTKLEQEHYNILDTIYNNIEGSNKI